MSPIKVCAITISVLLCGITALSTSAAMSEKLQPAAVSGTGQFDSLQVGSQGTGGVTYFNGSIVNSTTGDGGADNPVTFGDNVRIDGYLQRGAARTNDGFPVWIGDDAKFDGVIWGGPSKGNVADSQSLVIADTVRPAMDNINDFGSNGYRWQDGYFAGTLYAGSIDINSPITASQIADGTITSAKIQDGTINNDDLADGADISSDKIAGGVVSQSSPDWEPRDSFIMIPAAAFQPIEDGYDYDNSGYSLLPANNTSYRYVAPALLPHNATIEGMDFYWTDTAADNAEITLKRINLDLTAYTDMATASTNGAAGTAESSYDNTVDDNVVDNENFLYYLYLDELRSGISIVGVKIHYTYTEPY